jgi:aspartate/methionine/tyrosine aminotransferase
VGEMNPTIEVPQAFKEGIKEALDKNQTHYISPQGMKGMSIPL